MSRFVIFVDRMQIKHIFIIKLIISCNSILPRVELKTMGLFKTKFQKYRTCQA